MLGRLKGKGKGKGKRKGRELGVGKEMKRMGMMDMSRECNGRSCFQRMIRFQTLFVADHKREIATHLTDIKA